MEPHSSRDPGSSLRFVQDDSGFRASPRCSPGDSAWERYGSSTLKPDSIMPAPSTSLKPTDHLTPDEARIEHGRLGAEIAEHDRRYYEEDAPSVSDAEYDALRKRYEALEDQFPELKTPESLTQKVGSKVSEKFGKVRHRVPMLSLANAFADEEVEEFVER